MRVLILSSNNGNGHNASAEALVEYFSKNNSYCEIKDSLSFISESVSSFVSQFHNFSYLYASDLYNFNYRIVDNSRSLFTENCIPRRVLDLGIDALASYVLNNKFDCVISTHIFGAIMIEDACNKWFFNIPKYFVATDYSCTPGVEALRNTKIFIPDASLEYVFKKHTICKIICSGIPIKESFRSLNKVRHDGVHTLISVGNNNGKIKRMILDNFCNVRLKRNKIRLICYSKESYNDYSQFISENFEVINEVGSMGKHLDWADIYITKPGGLSVAETISKKVPMLLYKVINAYENENLEYVVTNDYGLGFDNYDYLFKTWCKIIKRPLLLNKYKQSLNEVKPNNACEIIYNEVVKP